MWKLKHLAQIEVASCGLTEVPPEMRGLRELTFVGLFGNSIRSLPPWILDLGLRITMESGVNEGIRLTGNPLEEPPIEVVSRGNAAIAEYFASIAEADDVPLGEAKLLLVGDGGSGKTSLTRRVLGKGFNPRESQTHGINIRDEQVAVDDQDVRLRLWDFGGQEIMHATHQFFLSKRSVYLLVLDGRRDEKVEYWLKHIRSFGGESPVLVVLNKMDEHAGYDLNRRFLQRKYPSIVGFFRTSCETGEGVDGVWEGVRAALRGLDMLQTRWPNTWFDVKAGLERMKDDFLSHGEFCRLCEKSGVCQEGTQETLVDFLHDLGVVVHFPDLKLEDTHVLQPEWATNGVYRILNSPELAEGEGVIEMAEVGRILGRSGEGEHRYPSGKRQYIIELMKKFELCYQLSPRRLLVPDLLPVQQPEFALPEGNGLRVVFDYDYLPRSVLPRLIVNLHHDVKGALRWRTGVVLHSEAYGCEAAVTADYDADSIEVSVAGKLPRDYFAIVRHAILRLNRDFEQVDVKELVPCMCEGCRGADAPHLFSYGALSRFAEKGIAEVPCDVTAEPVPVQALLSGVDGSDVQSHDEKLAILRELKDRSDSKETFLAEANKIVDLKPNIWGVGINLNRLAGTWFGRKRRKG